MAQTLETIEYYSDKGLSATFYDLVTQVDQTVKGDLDFYRSLAGPDPQNILVLGCGTGRVAIALAEAGHRIVGIDLAHSMLSRAELKKQRLPAVIAERLDFRPGDMTKADLDAQFDFVLIPYYGFSHLLTSEQRAEALAVVARHLRPAGAAVIHVPAPSVLHEAGRPSSPSRPRPGIRARLQSDKVAEVFVLLVDQHIDEEKQTFSQIIEYVVKDPKGQVTRRSAERLTYGLFDDNELKELAARSGLRVDRIFSSFGVANGRHRVYVLVRR
jgi:SAM-dependent methyltransferase